MAKGKLLIICGCANYIFMLFLLFIAVFAGVQITFLCCFYFLLQFHKMNVYICL